MILFVVMAFLSVFIAKVEASDVKAIQVLSLYDAISLALSRHPDIKSAEANLEIGYSRLGQAESSYYPSINMSAGLTRYFNSPSGDRSNMTASLGVNQNIYDFGKRQNRLDQERWNLTSYESDLAFTKRQVIYQVKKAYYQTLQAKEALHLADELMKQYEEHLNRAKGFYAAGLKPKYEVTKAEVDLANAKVNKVRAENNFRLALASLKNAIAMPDAEDFELQETAILTWEPTPLQHMIDRAIANRKDLQSLLSKAKAFESRIELEKAGYYPSLTGSAGVGLSGDRTPLDRNWSVGLSLTVPIFNGYLTRNLVKEAKASLAVVNSQIEALRQRIMLEVKQAYLNAIESRQRVEATAVSMRYAEENLELARGRYNAGVGGPLEVTDALTAYASAKSNHITARYDFNIALADIERATGE